MKDITICWKSLKKDTLPKKDIAQKIIEHNKLVSSTAVWWNVITVYYSLNTGIASINIFSVSYYYILSTLGSKCETLIIEK